MPEMKESINEEERTKRVSKMGLSGGLFQQCMKEIKESHTVGQSLRTAYIAAGVLTDKDAYAELLAQFYVATDVLEQKIEEYSSSSLMVKKVKNLGYNFRRGYELDLQNLLHLPGRDKDMCRNTVDEELATAPAKEYIHRLQNANEIEIVAAAFILWGPLIIGGGAALKPRVKKSFGVEATNVFEDVVGVVNGKSRSERRSDFIETYDGLLDHLEEKDKSQTFDSIVKAAGEFMSLNNKMMLAVKKRPFWSRYYYFVAAGVIVIAVTSRKLLQSVRTK